MRIVFGRSRRGLDGVFDQPTTRSRGAQQQGRSLVLAIRMRVGATRVGKMLGDIADSLEDSLPVPDVQ